MVRCRVRVVARSLCPRRTRALDLRQPGARARASAKAVDPGQDGPGARGRGCAHSPRGRAHAAPETACHRCSPRCWRRSRLRRGGRSGAGPAPGMERAPAPGNGRRRRLRARGRRHYAAPARGPALARGLGLRRPARRRGHRRRRRLQQRRERPHRPAGDRRSARGRTRPGLDRLAQQDLRHRRGAATIAVRQPALDRQQRLAPERTDLRRAGAGRRAARGHRPALRLPRPRAPGQRRRRDRSARARTRAVRPPAQRRVETRQAATRRLRLPARGPRRRRGVERDLGPALDRIAPHRRHRLPAGRWKPRASAITPTPRFPSRTPTGWPNRRSACTA